MRTSDFIHEMTQTAAILGRSSGTNVIFEGDEAKTDGKTIYLPALSTTGELTDHQVKIMRGYVDHEAGHHRHSDLERILDFYARNGNNGRKELSTIHNFLEDAWMEERVIKDYPGSYKNLKELGETVKAQEYSKIKDTPDDVLGKLNTLTATIAISSQQPNYHAEGNKHDKCLGLVKDDKIKEYGKLWVKQAVEAKDSEELIALAKSIYKLIQEDPEMESSNPEDFDPKSGEGMDEGEKAENSEEGEGKEGKVDGKSKSIRKYLPDDYIPDAAKAVNSEETGDGIGGGIGGQNGPLNGAYRVLSTKDDIEYRRGEARKPHGSPHVYDVVNSTDFEAYQKVMNSIGSDVRIMRSKLKRSLMAKQQRDWDFGKESGRLDNKRLVSAYKGVGTVYKTRTDREEMDTVITILVDLSGSMGGRKAIVARDCAVALAECMDASGVATKVVGFSNNSSISSVPRGKDKFHRVERLDTSVFKDYNTPLRTARAAIAELHHAIGGNNTDYDFIVNELAYLKRRPESRKILFVLSDGSPSHAGCSWGASGGDIKHCKDAVTEATRKDGIECIGIGILDKSVERIYPNAVAVNDIKELSGTVFTKLTSLLLKGQ